MKAGDLITCPHCGEKTVVKLKKDISGWQVTAEILICAMCSAKLGVPQKSAMPVSTAGDRLAALLGEAVPEKLSIDPGENFRMGCRNCAHLLEHPFKLMCALKQREVDPMDSCFDFQDRSRES